MIIIINSIKIIDEINRLLVEEYPERTVYIDICPKEFERPSFLIELITTRPSPANKRTIQETVYYSITCFSTTDDYFNSSTTDLLTAQQNVLNLFRTGYIKVDDRAIEVKASSGGRDFDQAYIDLQFEYFENRSDDEDTTPKMKEVITAIKEE